LKIPHKDIFAVLQLLVLRGCGLLSLFLVNVIVARHYDSATLGLFQIGLAWAMIMATVARLGQDQLMLRMAAEARPNNGLIEFHNTLSASMWLAFVTLLVGTCTAILLINWGPLRIEDSASAWFMCLMAISILPTGLLMIVTEALRGWQRINLSIVWQGSFPQTMTVVLVAAVALLINGNRNWIPVSYGVSFLSAALCAVTAWLFMSGLPLLWPKRHTMTIVFKAGLNFWIYAILTSVVSWIDVITLNALSDSQTVGEYSAIVRTGALLGTMVQVASAGVIAKMAMLYAKANYVEFADTFRRYFQLFAAAAIPLALLIVFFPTEIMSIWGKGHANDQNLFLIYAGFQVLNFMLCLTGFSVAVMRLEKQLVLIQLVALILKLVLIIIGYKLGGLAGVLWAAGLSLLAFNLLTGLIFTKNLQHHGVSLASLVLR
jgi:O-antigen/teichoic acid export membrane protein